MKCWPHLVRLGLFLLATIADTALYAQDSKAPFIDAKAVKERWSTVSPQDMEDMRKCRVLIASKSVGLNLLVGLQLLGRQDAKFNLMADLQRFDVEKKGGLPIIPGDVFKASHFVQFLATRNPLSKRIEEVDQLMRQPPWNFGNRVDVVMIIYAEVKPDIFPAYQRLTEALSRDFPKTRFIHATSTAFASGPSNDARSKPMHEFNELLRKQYRGKAPVYDLAAILSDDSFNGESMRPEYTKDPAGMHPSSPVGEILMAKRIRARHARYPTMEGSPGSWDVGHLGFA